MPQRFPILALYAATTLVGALLIFWIEPLFAKMMLPAFGGSPAVWTTALMFYQGVLLMGYGYSHLLTKIGRPRDQVLLHVGFLAVAALGLPPALPPMDALDQTATPIWSVLKSLAMGVGLPLMALSATAPLVQRWFAQTSHPAAGDPYFLYAASNTGSLAALLAFPFLLEPMFGLATQRAAWTVVYILLVGLIALCALSARRPLPEPPAGTADAGASGNGWRWVALAAVPSSLLSGVTSKITTDIASTPLFWTVPLALYLLTFILSFARRQVLPTNAALVLQAVLLVTVVVPGLVEALTNTLVAIIAHLAVFFLSALICHRALAASRPPAARLTLYYVAMAAGGLLGGSFNALLAPQVFTGIAEYPLALVCAVALRPGKRAPRDLIWPLAALAIAAVGLARADGAYLAAAIGALALVALGVAMAQRPSVMAGMLGAAFLMLELPDRDAALHVERNFYGVIRVQHHVAADANVLSHGTTIHGIQRRAAPEMPLGYYDGSGPLGEIFAALPPAARDDVAVIGLGTGAMACHLGAAGSVTFYEIDPAMIAVAKRPDLFSFIARCRADAGMVVGDGRLRLAASPRRYAMIVLDAFSSDAIPTHLLTREALRLYAGKLRPDGVLVVHYSNRHLALAPVLGATARAADLRGIGRCARGEAAMNAWSCWAVLSGGAGNIAPLSDRRGWEPLPATAAAWSDDFSDMLEPMLLRILDPLTGQP